MKEFSKLYLANYGNATKLIQGECGWGTENYTLDKTGAREWTYRAPYTYYGSTWNEVRCETTTKCATSKPADRC